MDELLESIQAAMAGASKVVTDKMTDDVMKVASENGISLLSLKHHSMLSYLQNILVLVGARLRDDQELYDQALKSIVSQRVVLEKGVKGLEAKINYQLEKVLRAHFKDVQVKEEKEKQKEQNKALAKERKLVGLDMNDDKEEDDSGGENEDENNSDNSEEEDDSSSEDEDELNYRPQPGRLASTATGDRHGRSVGLGKSSSTQSEASKLGAKYKAPKLAPVVPFSDKKESQVRRARNSAVEEYIRESASAPVAEPSIGSTIMDHGRGGERTERDRRKLKEVQQYEEENFTRLPGLSKKQERQAARKRQTDAITKSFFGEDWTFLDKGEKGPDGSNRKRSKSHKSGSSKKRRH